MTADTDYTEEVGWLLAEAKICGANVSRRAFDEWRQEGLLPKPKQVHLGRGLGSKSFYPTGTLQQVLICSAMLKKRRNLDLVRWKLWVRGFPVENCHIEKIFENAHRSLGSAYRFLNVNTESDSGWEVANKELQGNADRGQLPSFISRIKQRLGQEATPFLHLMLGVAIGSFTNYPGDPDSEKDRRLISRAFGLIAGKNKRAVGNPTFSSDLPKRITESISVTSAKIADVADPKYLQRLNLMELREAARDIYIGLRAAEFYEENEKIRELTVHPIYMLIHSIFDRISVEGLARIVLVWSSMRGLREYRGGAAELREELEARGIEIG